MKKIISLCLVIVSFALVITAFTACDGSEEEGTTLSVKETVVPSGVIDDYLFTAEIKEDSVIIKNNGEEFQVLKFAQNSGVYFDIEYAKTHYDFIDMNFDGRTDFYVAMGDDNGTVYCSCWLFNDTKKRFEPSPNLSALPNISVDADTHTIYSEIIMGKVVKIAEYGWVDGKLVLKNQYEKGEDVPETLDEVVSQNAIGITPSVSEKNDATESKTEAPTKNSGGSSGTTKTTSPNGGKEPVTKQEKPLDTTTTEPATDGIIVTDGDIDEGWF